jgi:hypothetical protein
MAQSIILKRSSLPGKVPDTGSLNIGEMAINTYDGKVFIKRSGNLDSIEGIVVTNSVTTGSISVTHTGSFGELVITQDANVARDLYVTNDIIGAGDIDITGDITGSSALLSGSLILSGSQTITNNLTVLGTVNARQFNISVISSSVLFQSGSTKFGDTLDDVHQFTGSVSITGSFLLNGQEVGGTTSGSFTGSFTGDGSGLRGVVSDDIPRDGWDYNANSSASISDFNNTSDKYYIDFEQSQSTAVGTPVGLKGFLTNVSGSTQILPTLNSIDFIVRDNLVASIGVDGITATAAAGTVSGSSQLTSSYDSRYVLSGSITETNWDNIASKPSGILSGSSQLTASVLATTGSNTFRGTQTLSGSIIPAIDNTYDLGSATYQWRDIYVSSGSLYIDGTKVLGSTGTELQITTDDGQSIKILEAGTDSIILQSADGNIELKSSGGGNLLFDPTTGLIDVRGTLQIQDGNKITSSGGNGVVFGNNIVISGSIESVGNINGINLNTFSSSIASTFSNQNSATSSYETKGRGIVSGSSQITYANISSIPSGIVSSSAQTIVNLPTGVISGSSQILGGSGLVSGSSQITYTNISSIPSGIVSGSSQITISSITGFNTFSSSLDSRILTEKNRVDAILLASDADKDSFTEIVSLINSVDTTNDQTFASFYTASVGRLNNLETTSGSVNTSLSNLNIFSGSTLTRLSTLEVETSNLEVFTSSINTTIKTRLNAETIVSGSSQVIGILSSLNTYTGSNDTTNTVQNSRLTSIESATGSYETKGRGIVSGSSQITLSSTSGYGSVLNQSVLTSSSPTFAGATINGSATISNTLNINSGLQFRWNGAFRGQIVDYNSYGGGSDYSPFITSETSLAFGVNGNTTKALNIASNGNSTFSGAVSAVSASFSRLGSTYTISPHSVGVDLHSTGNIAPHYQTSFSLYTGAIGSGVLKFNVNSSGDVTAAGTLTENSSIRYKENVETVKYGLDKVLQMRGVTYDKKNTGVKEMGVIAEEIYEVLPEVVLKNEEGELDSVSYGRITAVLIEAIKDLKKEIEELKANR